MFHPGCYGIDYLDQLVKEHERREKAKGQPRHFFDECNRLIFEAATRGERSVVLEGFKNDFDMPGGNTMVGVVTDEYVENLRNSTPPYEVYYINTTELYEQHTEDQFNTARGIPSNKKRIVAKFTVSWPSL